MVRRSIAFAAAALVAVLGLATAAQAQEYPPAPDSLTVSDSTVVAGASVTATAQVCAPGETVTFSFDGTVVGTAEANASGVATLTFAIPAGTAPGSYTLTATCGGQTLSNTITVEAGQGTGTVTTPAAVTPVGTGGTGGATALPRTGSDGAGTMARIGVVLVAAGGLALVLSRRRSSLPA